MYGFTLNLLNTLRVLGFKKTAVRAALFLDEHVKNDDVTEAASTYFYSGKAGFDQCTECYLPILSDTDDMHRQCRDDILLMSEQEEQALREYLIETQREDDQEALAVLIASFCTDTGCYEEGGIYGTCDKHTDDFDPEEDDFDGSDDEQDNTCSNCGEPDSKYDCPSCNEDPLAGDVDPTGGYFEALAWVQTGYGTWEQESYDPSDPKTWPAGFHSPLEEVND